MLPPIEKVLVIRFSSVGDILLSSLLLRVFRKRFPGCRIDYLVKADYAELVRHNPHVSNVIEFPSGGTFGALNETRRRITETRYDLLLDIHDSVRSRYLCWGQRRILRIDKRKMARFALVRTKLDLYRFFGGAPSVAERYLEPLQHLGVKNDGEGLEVHLPEEAKQKAHAMLENPGGAAHDPVIGMAPSALHANKMWPAENFAEAAIALWHNRHARFILFGSSRDRERCNTIEMMIKDRESTAVVINTAGETTLMEAAALMDYCALVVTNDSGLMHLATARKRKVVAIFGPTVREFGFFPYAPDATVVEHSNLACRPCTHIGLSHCPKGHFRCMNEIAPADVTLAARRLLEN